jgi:hypothetical protein
MNRFDPFSRGGWQESDAVLLAAESGLQESLAQVDAQSETGLPNSVTEPLWNEVGAQAHIIFNTPPRTLIGAGVKLRMLIHPELGIEEDKDSDVMVALRQVLDCVERSVADIAQRSHQANGSPMNDPG